MADARGITGRGLFDTLGGYLVQGTLELNSFQKSIFMPPSVSGGTTDPKSLLVDLRLFFLFFLETSCCFTDLLV